MHHNDDTGIIQQPQVYPAHDVHGLITAELNIIHNAWMVHTNLSSTDDPYTTTGLTNAQSETILRYSKADITKLLKEY